MHQFKRIILFAARYMCALIGCAYVFLAGFIFSRNRGLISQICNHFGLFIKKKVQPIIPKAKFSEITDSHLPVRVVEIEDVYGNTPVWEMLILNLLARAFQPTSIFEMGTFNGRTTLNLAMNAAHGAAVYTIDESEDDVIGSLYRNKDEETFPEKNRIVQLHGDTATFDFTPYVNKIDMVFIDGTHTYEGVLKDSEVALKLLKDGKSVIIWHDYDFWDEPCDEVTEALNTLHSRNPQLNLLHIEGTSLVCMVSR